MQDSALSSDLRYDETSSIKNGDLQIEESKQDAGQSISNIPRSGDPAYQWLFSQSDMIDTPSVAFSGLTYDQERFNRWKGVQLIFRIGDYMRLGNHVTCTASIFFQRFFMRKQMYKEGSPRTQDTFAFPELAPTCIFLACKVEETHRKLHSIVEATMAVLDRSPIGIQRCEAHMYRADTSSRDYQRWKDIVLVQEERLLEALCFDLIIDQPHPLALKGCMCIGVSRDMTQLTILLLNTFLYGAVCLFYDSATLAACAFYKACQLTGKEPQSYLIGTPYEEHGWSEAFDVDLEEVEGAIPFIDEYLSYHQEKIAPAPSTAQSTANTPLITQHVSIGKQPSETTNGQKQSRFAEEAPVKEVKESTEEVSVFASNISMIDVDGQQNDVQKESRTDSFRPISRHGSKAGRFGPPPPLSSTERSGPSMVDETVQAEDATELDTPAAAISSTYTMQSPKIGTIEDQNGKSADPHEEAAAEKITHEQAKLEKSEKIVNEMDSKDDGSEEEGAL